MATGRIIALNGPRGVGKTTAANAIKGARPDVMIVSMVEQFKWRVIAERGLDPTVYFDVFEALKDSPFPELGGRTPRDLYLERGEQERAKDARHLIKAWVKTAGLYVSVGFHVVIPDCRLADEFFAAFEIAPPKDVLLMRLKNPSKADPWAGDLGSWFGVAPLGHREMTLVNGDDLDYFKCAATHFGWRFLAVGR